MRFVLTIELGNDAMQTAGDVGRALREVATQLTLTSRADLTDRSHEVSGSLRDVNGNRVGGWHVEN